MQVWAYLPEIISPVTFVTFFLRHSGSGEWVWGVKSQSFGTCQTVLRHKNENGFLSNLGGGVGQSKFDICFP